MESDKSPLRRVIVTYQDVDDNLVERLECGHDFNIRSKYGFNYLPAKHRRCKECAKGVNV